MILSTHLGFLKLCNPNCCPPLVMFSKKVPMYMHWKWLHKTIIVASTYSFQTNSMYTAWIPKEFLKAIYLNSSNKHIGCLRFLVGLVIQASRSTYSEDSLRTLLKFEVFNVNHFQEKRSQTHQFFRLKISRN